MEEVEVKILEINPQHVAEALIKLGAKKVYDGDIQTLFIDTKDGEIHKRRDVLRLRKEKDKAQFVSPLKSITVVKTHPA